MEKVKHSQRNTSFELLRIIAMVMIVFHHFASHGGFSFEGTSLSCTHLWYNFIVMGGKIGVDIFVLISGYFLISDNGEFFNFKRVLKFWGQVFFYAVVITALLGVTGISPIGIKDIIKAVFPITTERWWFASTYFVMYIIHPFLNKFLTGIDKKTYQKLLVMLMILWSIIPTFTTCTYQGNPFIWFICLYSVAGYIRLYGLNENIKIKHYFIISVILCILTYLSSVVFSILGLKWDIFAQHTDFFYGHEKITAFLVAICIFMAFSKLNIKYNKGINIIASATFGVYLIHDSYNMRPLLWETIFKNASYQNNNLLIPYSIFVVIVVYIVCTALDLLRKYAIEKPFMIFVNKYADSIIKPFNIISEHIKNFVFGKQ